MCSRSAAGGATVRRITALDNDLQSFQPLVAARVLGSTARRAGRCGRGNQEHDDRYHVHQDPTHCIRRKRGRSAQAIPGRLDHEDSCAHRRRRPSLCADADAGQCQRHQSRARRPRTRRSHAIPVRRQRLQCRRLRRSIRAAGAVPVIPGRRNPKRTIRYDKQRYRGRYLVANAFCRLKDFRRVATRYDKLAANFLSTAALATAVTFWL